MVDRDAFDKLIQEGGYVSVNTGSAPDANSIPVKKKFADLSMDEVHKTRNQIPAWNRDTDLPGLNMR